MAKQKFYVVWVGQQPGIYTTWADCAEQVQGFSAAKYKAFPRSDQAKAAYEAGWEAYIGKPTPLATLPAEVISDSISVDAACDGSPGNLEYRGVYTASGKELFHHGPLKNGTNNLGEFLAIVHALALLQKEGQTMPLYSDSHNALMWVEKHYIGSRLPRNEQTIEVWTLADRALAWLKNNSYPNKILKWKTVIWGEIRADFGRK